MRLATDLFIMKTAWIGILAAVGMLAVGCAEAPASEEQGDSAAAETAQDKMGALDAQTAARGRHQAELLLQAGDDAATMTVASSFDEVTEWRYDVSEKGFRLTGAMRDSTRETKRIAYAMETKDGQTQLIGLDLTDNFGDSAYIDRFLESARDDLAAAMKNIPEMEDPTGGAGLDDVAHRCSDHTLKVLRRILAAGLTTGAAGGVAVWTGVGTVAGGIAITVSVPVVFATGQAIDWCGGTKEVRVF